MAGLLEESGLAESGFACQKTVSKNMSIQSISVAYKRQKWRSFVWRSIRKFGVKLENVNGFGPKRSAYAKYDEISPPPETGGVCLQAGPPASVDRASWFEHHRGHTPPRVRQ